MAASRTLNLLRKILVTGQPAYFCDKLRWSGTRTQHLSLVKDTHHKFWLSAEDFLERAMAIYNKLPDELKLLNCGTSVKKNTKIWIKSNIPATPKTRA